MGETMLYEARFHKRITTRLGLPVVGLVVHTLIYWIASVPATVPLQCTVSSTAAGIVVQAAQEQPLPPELNPNA